MAAVAAGGVRCRNAGAVAAGAVALPQCGRGGCRWMALRRVDAPPQINALLQSGCRRALRGLVTEAVGALGAACPPSQLSYSESPILPQGFGVTRLLGGFCRRPTHPTHPYVPSEASHDA